MTFDYTDEKPIGKPEKKPYREIKNVTLSEAELQDIKLACRLAMTQIAREDSISSIDTLISFCRLMARADLLLEYVEK